MSVGSSAARSSAARTQRYRARQRQGTRCITVHVNENSLEALVARYYLTEESSSDPAAIKAAVEGLMADLAFDLATEKSTRNQAMKRVTNRHGDA